MAREAAGTRRRGLLLLLVLVLVGLTGPCLGLARKDLYPHSLPGGQTLEAEPSGQIGSAELKLKSPVTLFERNYTSAYINGNGVLSFIRPIHRFLNIPFPLDDPVIAPLYTHVDIRGAGAVHYVETEAPEVLAKAAQAVRSAFRDSAPDFEPRHVLLVTWLDVGYFNTKSDKLNTFQVAVASNGTHSYAELLYPENGIQWIQGESHPNGLPDAKAQVGLMGEGRMRALPGSGTDQVINIDKWSNVGRPGHWLFQLGPIYSNENVREPETAQADQRQHLKTCHGGGATHCHSKASCVDYAHGYCCSCKPGFFGNGHTCHPNDVPLRIIGKVSGKINDQSFQDMDLQCYVQTKDGRTYTALSRIPEAIGASYQLLNPFNDIISWLFAKTTNETQNGYQITGGLFNHTMELKFDKTSDRVTITNHYLGLDVFGQLKLTSHIVGSLPRLSDDSRVEYTDHEEILTRVDPGVLRSNTARSYRIATVPDIQFPFTEDQTVRYQECEYSGQQHRLNVSKVKFTRGVTTFEPSDSIIRFANNAKVTPLEEEDPCVEGRKICSYHSSCVADEESFKCICNPGYQHLYNEDGTATCVDIDECRVGNHNCAPDAECHNSEGTYGCHCHAGFTGDGRTCERLPSCSETRCGEYEQCIMMGHVPVCTCIPGFEKMAGTCRAVQQIPCNEANDCSPLGTCEYNEERQVHLCTCVPGYVGDGYNCYSEYEDLNNHPPVPQCQANMCWCPTGWSFQNGVCQKDDMPFEELGSGEDTTSCNVLNRCDPFATCVYDMETDNYSCQCLSGYVGDGLECSKMETSCLEVDTCDPNASCRQDEANVARCVCNSGYKGDGITCTPFDECREANECDDNEECSYVASNSRYECTCLPGYDLTDNQCVLADCSGNPGQCHPNAQCVRGETGANRCTCNKGYYGDGLRQCVEEKLGCSVVHNCGRNAICAHNQTSDVFACICLPGYVGNGFTCTAQASSCHHNPSLCSKYASCVAKSPESHVCVCHEGFEGDGTSCRPRSPEDMNFLLVNQGTAIHKLPLLPPGRPGTVISQSYQQMTIALDIDCPAGRIYYSDITGNKIVGMAYNGSKTEKFIAGVSSPEGITVDWVSRLIFWADSSKKTIEVAHLMTRKRKVLFTDGLENPRGVAVHPHRGKLFWSDWYRSAPKIEWSNEDGTGRQIYLQGKNVALPNALAIDWISDELCWTDAGTLQISCAQIDTRATRVLVKNLAYPFGLAISQNNLYWTDWKTNKVEVAVKENGKRMDPITLPPGGNGKLYGVTVVGLTCPSVTNICASQHTHHQCHHDQLCLPDGFGGRTCACADNAEMPCIDTRH